MDRREFEAARQLHQQYVEANPGVWQAHLGLGQAYFQLRKFKEAIGEYQEVLRLAPQESAPAFYGIGEIFHQQGRPPEQVRVWFDHAEDNYMKKQDVEGYDFVRRRRTQIGLD